MYLEIEIKVYFIINPVYKYSTKRNRRLIRLNRVLRYILFFLKFYVYTCIFFIITYFVIYLTLKYA